MAAASSGLAPSVSSKSLRAEFLNYVATIPDDQLGEEMAISEPAGMERWERCSRNSKTPQSICRYKPVQNQTQCDYFLCLTSSCSSLACNHVHKLFRVSLGIFPPA